MASAPVAIRRRKRVSAARLAVEQIDYQNRMLLRSPLGAFFTFVVPLMLLLALNALQGSRMVEPGLRFAQFFTPAMAAFAIVNACYINLLTGVTRARDEGILKRFRGSALPAWTYMIGRIGSAGVVAVLSVGVVIGAGILLYHVRFFAGNLAGLIVVGVAGILAFCALGVAVTILVPASDAAIPVAFGTILPVAFVSGVFFPLNTGPAWLRTAASALPLKPLASGFEAAFRPGLHAGIPWIHVLELCGWALVCVLVASRWFRWERRARGARRHR